jgi:hypothetical protein
MSYLDILSQRDGFGKNATGGTKLYKVTTLADSGPGSLREALQSSESLWIHFDVSGKIVCNTAIYAKPNKTVDARGRAITIKGATQTTGPLRLYDTNNIILLNLTFDNEWPDWATDSEGADAITILNASNIWIHHCRFMRFSDAGIDTKTPTTNLSVTWSRFKQIWQACAWQGNNLSIGYSICESVGARFPKAIDGSVVSYNNILYKWSNEGIQGVKGTAGELLAWRCMYRRSELKQCNDRAEGKIQTTAPWFAEGLNDVEFVGGSDAVSRTFVDRVKAVCKVSEASQSLYDQIMSKAGPTLAAVSYDPIPTPTPTPPTMEQRVADLERRVQILETT